ncbi:MAG: type II toxin-antitoxin system HicB family antitoxin [Clostridia bacterium]|nr:type II toxin-antitoxin system HicB family antitoxin [Clostridia bacterium]
MKNLVYPAVLYKDDERGSNTGWYTISIPDLGIVTEGETIVDAYIKAKEYLCAMVDCAIKFDCDIEAPSSFEKLYAENNKGKTKNIVLLVDALA